MVYPTLLLMSARRHLLMSERPRPGPITTDLELMNLFTLRGKTRNMRMDSFSTFQFGHFLNFLNHGRNKEK